MRTWHLLVLIVFCVALISVSGHLYNNADPIERSTPSGISVIIYRASAITGIPSIIILYSGAFIESMIIRRGKNNRKAKTNEREKKRRMRKKR